MVMVERFHNSLKTAFFITLLIKVVLPLGFEDRSQQKDGKDQKKERKKDNNRFRVDDSVCVVIVACPSW